MALSRIPHVWKNHPEKRAGEVFLTNTSDDAGGFVLGEIEDFRSGWEAIGWKTKRRGNTAYDIYGKPIRGMFPVFVQRAELVRGGVDPDAVLNHLLG